jgi:hypothetical protein
MNSVVSNPQSVILTRRFTGLAKDFCPFLHERVLVAAQQIVTEPRNKWQLVNPRG